MEYTLCSSSEEEGQVTHTNVFPTNITVLQYCYYPNTSIFIGDNTIPRLSDYQDRTMTVRMKKKLRKEYFDTIGQYKDKAFFDNKFTLVYTASTKGVGSVMGTNEVGSVLSDRNGTTDGMELDGTTNTDTIAFNTTNTDTIAFNTTNTTSNSTTSKTIHPTTSNNTTNTTTNTVHPTTNTTNTTSNTNTSNSTPLLLKVDSSYKHVTSVTLLKKSIDPYLDLFIKLVYQNNSTDIILIKDSTLNRVNKNVFIHFRVLKNNNILFEDTYYKSMNVYEYMQVYYEEICKEYKSYETRWYEYSGHKLVVFSCTTFIQEQEGGVQGEVQEGVVQGEVKEGVHKVLHSSSAHDTSTHDTSKHDDEGNHVDGAHNSSTHDTTVLRYYNTIDCKKNYVAVMNNKKMDIKKVQVGEYANIRFIQDILDLRLPDGDYAYNMGDIYKISMEGIDIPYEGIDYELSK